MSKVGAELVSELAPRIRSTLGPAVPSVSKGAWLIEHVVPCRYVYRAPSRYIAMYRHVKAYAGNSAALNAYAHIDVGWRRKKATSPQVYGSDP
jgi:hypothetical protein